MSFNVYISYRGCSHCYFYFTLIAFFQWYPEVTQHCPNIPVILVGTKGDLVDTKSEQHAHCKARALKKRLNLKQYVETSAMKNEGLHNVFQEVVQAVLRIPTKQKPICKSDKNVDSNKKCVIM